MRVVPLCRLLAIYLQSDTESAVNIIPICKSLELATLVTHQEWPFFEHLYHIPQRLMMWRSTVSKPPDHSFQVHINYIIIKTLESASEPKPSNDSFKSLSFVYYRGVEVVAICTEWLCAVFTWYKCALDPFCWHCVGSCPQLDSGRCASPVSFRGAYLRRSLKQQPQIEKPRKALPW